MNILILAAGTRNKVVQYFKKTFDGIGQVIATDANNLGPAKFSDLVSGFPLSSETRRKPLPQTSSSRPEDPPLPETISEFFGRLISLAIYITP